jgi:hypothetical protein
MPLNVSFHSPCYHFRRPDRSCPATLPATQVTLPVQRPDRPVLRAPEMIPRLTSSRAERRLLALPQTRTNYITLGEASSAATSRCAQAWIAYGLGRHMGYQRSNYVQLA